MASASVLEVRIAEAVMKESVSALNRPARGLQVQNSCIVTTENTSRFWLKIRYPAFRNGTKKISRMTARNLTLQRRSLLALLFYSDSSSKCFLATNSQLKVPLIGAFSHIS